MAKVTHSDSSAYPDGQPASREFQLAGWTVSPTTNRMSLGAETIRLEPKVMEVLVYLANRPGQTVTRDELVGAVWSGTVVSDDAVTNAIIKLRKAFGDESRSSAVIETIPKRGYRLVAGVKRLTEDETAHVPAVPADPVADNFQPHAGRPTISWICQRIRGNGSWSGGAPTCWAGRCGSMIRL